MVVTPALAAAMASLLKVALRLCPGSRNRVLKSINPGHIILFVASITVVGLKPAGSWVTETTLPSAI